MKLVILIGAGAVGKMTVGQELMKITDLRLYHNHMSIEPVVEIFGYRNFDIVTRLREVIFDEFAKTDLYGMIFTYMMDFDCAGDAEYLERLADIFRARGADIYYVELHATQEVRLARNGTENRLTHKATKRDVEASNERVKYEDATSRMVSYDGELTYENYMKIDNTELSPSEVAKMIVDKFGLIRSIKDV